MKNRWTDNFSGICVWGEMQEIIVQVAMLYDYVIS